MTQEVFKRYEKKYLLSNEAFETLLPHLDDYLTIDQYGKHTICNIYFDTSDYSLIRTSIEKPLYKEKVRLRSYGTPTENDTVFLELKKKFDGIVYKRRVPLILKDALNYVCHKTRPPQQSQIQKELDWVFDRYRLNPAVYLSYDRIALFGKDDINLRITFDFNIRCRESALNLESGTYGTQLLHNDEVLMEIKIAGAMPLWLSHLLSTYSIFPTSFSKYGEYYKEFIHQGGNHCA